MRKYAVLLLFVFVLSLFSVSVFGQSYSKADYCPGVCGCVASADGDMADCNSQCGLALLSPNPQENCFARLAAEELSECFGHCSSFPTTQDPMVTQVLNSLQDDSSATPDADSGIAAVKTEEAVVQDVATNDKEAVAQETEVKIQSKGSVENIKGRVEIKQADGTWKEISGDAVFAPGDVIRTGEQGTATLKFSNNFEARLGPKTSFKVSELDSEKSFFDLQKGKIWAKVNKFLKQRFSVRTPTAVHAVRGTEFILAYDEVKNETKLQLFEGVIEITPTATNEMTVVNAGETAIIGEEGIIGTESLQTENWNTIVEESVSVKELRGKLPPPEKNNTNLIIIVSLVLIVLAAVAYIVFTKKK